MSIRVMVSVSHRSYRPDKKSVTGYVKRVFSREGKRRASVSLVFVGSRLIRRLNRQFLRHDYVTDVIAFPLGDADALEGEIYVNVDRARSQAAAYGVSLKEEIARLVIHGALHLAGHDDGQQRAARRMKKAENTHVSHWFDKQGGEG